MFNRKLELKIVKDTKQNSEEKTPLISQEDYAQFYATARMLGKDLFIGAALLYGTCKALDAASQIVVHRATK